MLHRIETLMRTFWFYLFLVICIVYFSLYTDFYDLDINHSSVQAIALLALKTIIVCFTSMSISLIISHFIVKKKI